MNTHPLNLRALLGLVFATAVSLQAAPTRSLVNLSALLDGGTSPGTTSFTIEGSVPKAVLIRAVGPRLGDLSVTGFMPDPVLTVYNGFGLKVGENDNWGSAASSPAIVSATATAGATTLLDNSKDAAVLLTLAPGTYTARVDGASGSTGKVLVEVYDADATPRLAYLNLNVRLATSATAVAGFTIAAGPSQTVLIRAIGPALSSAGVAGTLANPALQLFSGATSLATNDNWGNATANAALSDAAATAGLRPLADGSNDAAILTTLAAGSYTAQVTGNGGSGVTHIEIAIVDADRAASMAPAFIGPVQASAGHQQGGMTYSAVAIGKPAPTYQWKRNGTDIVGATSGGLALNDLAGSDAASYSVTVANSAGSVISLASSGTVWQLTNPKTGITSNLNGVAYSGTVYAAVSDAGFILTSTDTVTWVRPTPQSGSHRGIVYGGGRFVAVGSSGGVRYSTDNGGSWLFGTAITANTLRSVVHDGTRFIAVGDNSTVIYSTDGLNWTAGNLGTTGKTLNAVAYKSGGNYVAVASDGSIFSTANVTTGTWTAATSGTTNSLNGVGVVNNLFVAVGSNGTIRSSSTGAGTWTNVTSPTSTSTLNSVAYSGSLYVIAGGNTLLTSTDATTWTQNSVLPVGGAGSLAVIYAGGKFVSVGFPGCIVTSTTGASGSWTLQASVSTSGYNDAVYADGRFVAVGGNSSVLVTTDGVTSSALTPPLPVLISTTLRRIAFGAGVYVAVGDNGTIISSPDATTWSNRSFGTTNYYGLTYGAGKFVAAGSNGTYLTSTDGISWTTGTGNIGTARFTGLTYGGATPVFVAVNDSGGIYTSPDAITWTGRTSGTTNALNSVRFVAGQFVAVGSSSTVLTSSDGATWTHRGLGVAGINLTDVGHGGGLTLLVHSTNAGNSTNFSTIFLSTDLVTWTPSYVASAFGAPFNFFSSSSIAYGNGVFVVPANAGYVTRSLPNTGVTRIATQPVNAALVAGSTTLSVATNGVGTATYQWFRGFSGDTSNLIAGATNATYTATASDRYWVRVGGSGPTVNSATVAVTGGTAPVIAAQPQNVSVTVGQNASFSVTATSSGTLAYQWRRNGFPIAGATNSGYTVTAAQQSHADNYDVVVSDGLATTTSNPARLGVAPTVYPAGLKLDPALDFAVESANNGQITAIAPYGTNQFIIGGDFLRINGVPARRLARVNADGTVDPTFNAGLNWLTNGIIVQADNKVIVAGNFSWVNSQLRSNLVRFNNDGSLDGSFPNGSGPNGAINAIVRQSDGKLIIGGSFTNVNGSTANRICRLNADGSLDTTFSVGSTQGVNNTVNSLALDPLTGKVVLGGSFTAHSGGASLNRIARFNTDGTNDTSFAIGSGFDNTVSAVAFNTTASTVVAGGSFSTFNGSAVNRLARLAVGGTLDTTFNATAGTGYTAAPTVTISGGGGTGATATATVASGAITGFTITGGSGYTSVPTVTLSGGGGTGAAAAATISGGVVTAINLIGSGPNGTVNTIAFDSAGSRWIIGGSFTAFNGGSALNRLARLSAAGVLDTGFNPNVDAVVQALAVNATDSSLVFGGSFFNVSNQATRFLARVTSTGARDTSLTVGMRGTGNITSIRPLPGGKLLVAGSFTHFGATFAPYLARLSPSLTVESVFNPVGGSGYTAAPTVTISGGGGTGAVATANLNLSSNQVSSITVTAGGTGYTAAPTVTISAPGGGGVNATAIASVSGGAVTNVFLSTASNMIGANGAVNAALIQGDGRIVIAGGFTSYNGTTANRVARLNPDLTLDTSFNVISGPNNTVNALALVPGGGVYIGGSFSNVNNSGSARAGVARLNPDGTLDLGFNAGSASFTPIALALQPDGKVLAGGGFTSVNGSSRNNIVRLNSDGSFDTAFPATGANGTVRAITLQPDGQILIGGDFTSYNGTTINNLARVNGSDGTLDATFAVGTRLNSAVYAILRQENGAVVPFGFFGTTVTGAPNSRNITRLTTTGDLDPSLNFSGPVGTFLVTTVPVTSYLLDDGRVLIGTTSFTSSGQERDGLILLSPSNLPTVASISPASVRPGATLTITGSGFSDGLFGLSFNGVGLPISVSSVTDTQIVLPVPANATSGPVTVRTFTGNATSTASLTVAPDFQLRTLPTASTMNMIARNGSVFVAVGDVGEIFRSTNGIDWTGVYHGGAVAASLRAVTYANGLFVAVGNSATILTSPDGLAWTQRAVQTTASFNALTYAGGKFIALTTNSTVATSTDGIAWTAFASTGGGTSNAVAANATTLVAVGASGVVRTSLDGGVTWTARTSGSTQNLNGVLYTGTQFLAVGANAALLTSPDGVTWTARTAPAGFTTVTLYGPLFVNNKYVVGGSGGVLLSDDGVTWTGTNVNVNGGIDMHSVVHDGTQFVGTGFSCFYSSPDAAVWTLRAQTSRVTLNDLTYGNGRYVAVGASNSVFQTSTDGVAWSAGQIVPGGNQVFGGVAYGKGLFVAVGNSTLFTSADGVSWTNRTPSGSFTFNSVAFGGGTFVAVGNTGVVYRSTDGIAWTAPATVTANALRRVAYGNGMFVAVGASGTTLTSTDGNAWNVITPVTTNQLNAIHYNGTQWVAVGASSTVLTSTNATTWTAQNLGTAGVNLIGVAYGDGGYVAINTTSGPTLYYSPDAITWTPAFLGFQALSVATSGNIVYANGRFAIATQAGMISSSNPASDTFRVTTQPLAASVVAPNGTATLSVAATGTGLSYQWYAGLSGDVSTPVGTNAASFTTPAITAPRSFWVRVTSGSVAGPIVVDSATATVSSTASGPVISAQPADVAITAGQSANFGVTATGTGALSYQWLRNGIAVPGATNSSYAIAGASRADADYYSAAVSDTFGNTTVSAAARLSVAPGTYPQGTRVDAAFSHLYERNSGTLNRVLLQTDGKLIVAGDFTNINGTARTRLARFNTDGSVDPAFTPPLININIAALAQDANGKILVGGDFIDVGGTPSRDRLIRLNSDGTLDATFNPTGAGPTSTVNVIRVLANGQILIGGFFGSYNNSTSLGLARLNADGTFDPTFAVNITSSSVNAMVQQADGKILIGGNFGTVNGLLRNRLARLNADGTIDTTFDPGVGPNNQINALALDGTGILIGGTFTTYGGAPANRIARLTSTGAIESTFSLLGGGTGYTSAPTVAFSGGGGSGATATATFNPTTGQITGIVLGAGGSGYTSVPTVSFSGGGGTGAAATATVTGGVVSAITLTVGANNTVNEIVVQPDNKILVGGAFTSYAGVTANGGTRLARLSSLGVVDTTFAIGSGANSTVLSLAVDSSNNIVAGGSFGTINGTGRFLGLARFSSLGVLDTAINPGAWRNGVVTSITPLAGGKTLVAGDFVLVDGVPHSYLARLNADGSVETAFNTGASANSNGPNAAINAAYVQADGKIVIVGSFTTVNGVGASRIARLNPDASLDPTFSTGGGAGSAVGYIVPQPDGKLILGGNALTSFTYAGVTRNGLVRVNPDGTADASFAPPAFGNTVEVFAVQRDGKVLVGGAFTTLGGVTLNRFARLNADGTADTAFNANVGTGANNTIRALTLQSDGKIMIGGDFTTFNGAAKTRVARLNADGTLDNGFDAGATVTSTVNRILVQDNGGLLLRGGFSIALGNGTNANSIVRLTASGALDPGFTAYGITFNSQSGFEPLLIADDGTVLAGGYFYALHDGEDYRFAPPYIPSNTNGFFRLGHYTAPFIIQPLVNQVAAVGSNVTLLVGAAGSPPFNYVWFKDGVVIPGATGLSLTLNNLQPRDAGSYGVDVSNLAGSTYSVAEVGGPNPAPTITTPVAPTFATAGGNATLTVAATGTGPLGYQWFKAGQPIAGATNAALTLSGVGLTDAGIYSVQVNSGLSTEGSAARVEVRPATYPGALRLRPSFAPKFENVGNLIQVTLLADGRFYGVGTFNTANDVTRYTVARFLATGALDPTFVPAVISGGNTTALVVQPDGKVVIGGGFTTVGGTTRSFIARLNPDGTVDSSFAPGPGFNASVLALALQSDGKILAAGAFASFNGNSVGGLARLNSDGTLDASFAIGSAFSSVSALVVQPDGKIVVGGSFTSFRGASVSGRIARVNPDGSLDTSFAVGLGFDNTVFALALQADGKVIAGGSFINYAGTGANRIARLNANGSLDTTFVTGTAFSSTVSSLAIQPADGKIVVGGQFTSYSGNVALRVARLTSSGAFDAAFGAGVGAGVGVSVTGVTGNVGTLAVQSDGAILIGGAFNTVNNLPHVSLARLGSNGVVEAAFNPSLRTAGAVIAMVPVSGGGWLVGGLFTHVDNLPAGNFVRLTATGAVDTAFNANVGTGFSSSPNVIVPQPNGKFVVGGVFTSYNGIVANRIARLNADGTFDSTFAVGAGFNNTVSAIVQGADGALTVGGAFTSFNGESYNRIVRLTADGAIDFSFDPGLGFNGLVTSLALRPDDDGVVVGGASFSTFNGVSVPNLARLNGDGSLDPTFAPVPLAMASTISALVVLPDNRVLVGGGTTFFTSATPGLFATNAVARLRANGSIDTDFAPSTGAAYTLAASAVRPSIALQGDGKILVSGAFAGYNGEVRGGLARLNPDGTTDQSFGGPVLGTGLSTQTNLPIVYGADGLLLVGGLFFNFADRVLGGLAAYEAASPALAIHSQPNSVSVLAGQDAFLSVGAIGLGNVTYQWKLNGVNVTDSIGRVVGATTARLVVGRAQAADAGNYTVVVTDSSGSITSAPALLGVAATAPVASIAPAIGASVQETSFNVMRANVTAGTAPISYQWIKNGVDIPGASGTGPTNGPEFGSQFDLAFPAPWQPSDAGDYSIRLTNSVGSTTTGPVRAFSNEGAGWTFHNQYPTSSGFLRVWVVNGQFMALGLRGGRYVSNDGIAWTQLPSTSSNSLYEYFQANGRHYIWGSGYYVDSVDGVRWTSHTTGLGGEAESFNMAFGNGAFVSASTNGGVIRSTDGLTWNYLTFGNASNVANVSNVAFGNGNFVLLNGYGAIYRSADGQTWTPQTPPAGPVLDHVRFVNGQFIAYGPRGALATSSDGVSWIVRTTGVTDTLHFPYFANGTYVVGAEGRVLTSTDLVTWTPRILPGALNTRGDGLTIGSVAFLNGTWVVNCYGINVLYTSTNAIDWTQRSGFVGNLQQYNGIAAAPSSVVAVASGGVITRSTDGVVLTDQSSGTTNSLNDVLYANGAYLAVGNSGTIIVGSSRVDLQACKLEYSIVSPK